MSSVVISGDTSGAITLSAPAVAGTNTITLPASTGTVLAGGNQPAFLAYLSAQQTVTDKVYTKVQINTEVFDTANAFDNATNYRFTPQVAGYYQVSACVGNDSVVTNPTFGRAALYKNGSLYCYVTSAASTGSPAANTLSSTLSIIMYLNGSSDYIELYGFNANATQPVFIGNSTLPTYFSASLVRAA